MLSADELRRYARQLTLPDFGVAGQERLAGARVLVVGVGGLGSPVALWLAAAGVGRLTLVDPDRVDVTNLHRQLLFGTGDVGRPKVEAARARLREANPHVQVDVHATALDATNAAAFVAGHDVVVDATDTFAARYAASDACAAAGTALVHGSISRWEGQATVLVAGGAPCYRCLFPEPPAPGALPSCAEAGVLGVLPGLVGMVQATETLKLLAGVGETLAGRLLLVDGRAMRFRTIAVRRAELCPACGRAQIGGTSDAAPDRLTPDEAPAARRTEPPMSQPSDAAFAADPIYEMPPAELAARLRGAAPPLLVDVREPWEHAIAALPDARLVPLQSLPMAVSTFDPSRQYVVYCHHGMRSRMAIDYLRGLGFTRLWNLEGGIARWSEEVDPSVPRY